MRHLLSPLVVLSLALHFTPASPAQPVSAAWPMFRHDARHTGRSEYVGPNAARLAWSYAVDGLIWSSSPALGTDGRSYVGTTGRRVYAFESSGALAWSHDVGVEADVSPAVGADGGVYAASLTAVLKFDSAGGLAWSYGVLSMKYSSPVLDPGGRMYVGSQNNNLYAMNPGGSLAWSYRAGWDIQSSPALGSEGRLYFGSVPADCRVYCVDSDGTLAWSYTGGGITSSPALGEDGRVYVGSLDNNLYALDSDGGIAWSYAAHGAINYSSPALGSDGTVCVGAIAPDTRFYAVTTSGKLRWSYATGGGIESSPAVAADGAVYVGGLDGRVYGLASDGRLMWSYQAASLRASSPAIGSDGRVHMGTTGSRVLVFHGPTPIPTPTPPRISLIVNTTAPSTGDLLTIEAEVRSPVIQAFDAYGVIEAPDGGWFSFDMVNPWSVMPGVHPLVKGVPGLFQDTAVTLLKTILPPLKPGPYKVTAGMVPAGALPTLKDLLPGALAQIEVMINRPLQTPTPFASCPLDSEK